MKIKLWVVDVLLLVYSISVALMVLLGVEPKIVFTVLCIGYPLVVLKVNWAIHSKDKR